MTYERQAVDGALADKLAAARMSLERMRAEYQRSDEWTATLHLNVALAALDDVERALRAGPPIETPVAKVVPLRKLAVVGRSIYPPGWPKCRCGQRTLDGHLTCWNVDCDESGARGERLADWMERTHGGPDDAG